MRDFLDEVINETIGVRRCWVFRKEADRSNSGFFSILHGGDFMDLHRVYYLILEGKLKSDYFVFGLRNKIPHAFLSGRFDRRGKVRIFLAPIIISVSVDTSVFASLRNLSESH